MQNPELTPSVGPSFPPQTPNRLGEGGAARAQDVGISGEGVVKLLPEAEAKILDDQMETWHQLNTSELHSELRDSFTAGDTVMPAGTYLHGVRSFDSEKLLSVATYGILSGELKGQTEDGETHWCADFYRTTKEQKVGDYLQEVWGSNNRQQGGLKKPPMEKFLPRNTSMSKGGESLAFVIDTRIPELQPLLAKDAYRDQQGELTNIVNTPGLPINPDSDDANRIAAVLVGVPRGSIAGIVLGDKIIGDSQKIDSLRQIFGLNMPLLSVEGELLPPNLPDTTSIN